MSRVKNDQLTENEKRMICRRIKNVFDEYTDQNPGFTQKDLSEKTGISTATISRIFNPGNDDKFITLYHLMKISRFFNVNLDYLVGSSNSRRTGIEKRAIAERLQLSDKAVDRLLSLSEEEISCLDLLLSSKESDRLLDQIDDYMKLGSAFKGFTFVFFGKYKTEEDSIEAKEEEAEIILSERIKQTLKTIKENNNGKKK